MLEKVTKVAKDNYSFAKHLNYAYSIGDDLFGLVFTKQEVPLEVIGGTMVMVNSKTLKHTLFPVRPQTIEALNKYGKVEKVFSVDFKEEDSLKHFGILGMKWGIRRYQNSDGSLTTSGKKRYIGNDGKLNTKAQKDLLVTPRGQMTDRGKRTYLDSNGKLNAEGKKYFKETDKGRIVKKNRSEIEEAAPKKSLGDKVSSLKEKVSSAIKPSRKEGTTDTKDLNRNPKNLSDQELQALTNRLGLEQRYSQLTAEKASAGSKAVKAALPIIGAAAVGIGGKILISRAQGSWSNYVSKGGLIDGSKLPKFTQLGSPYYSKMFEESVPKVSSAIQSALNAYFQIQKDK